MDGAIGLFGGSFDPPHKGHKKLALFMKEALALEKLIIMPAFLSPFKESSGADSKERFEMCKLCFSESFFEVSELELLRGGKSYTIDTVKEIKKLYPEKKVHLIIGSDQLLHFHKWYKFSEISENAVLCAVSRDDPEIKAQMEEYADKYLRQFGEVKILDFNAFAVSSTDIRHKIGNNENLEDFVDSNVLSFINLKGLYKDV